MSNKNKKPKKPSKKQQKITTTPAPSFQIEKIKWEDHFSGNTGWTYDHSLLRTDPTLVITVGIKVAEDKKTVTLAQNMGENLAVADTTTIIKSCIVTREQVGEISYGVVQA